MELTHNLENGDQLLKGRICSLIFNVTGRILHVKYLLNLPSDFDQISYHIVLVKVLILRKTHQIIKF